MDESIRRAIIELLGDFAETSGRYSNINILLGKKEKSNDCVEQWFRDVDMPLYSKHITAKRKNGIEQRAIAIGSLLSSYSLVRFMAEDNRELTDAAEASRRTGIWEAVAPYRQVYMLQIIRYLVELLIGLGHKARKNGPEDIPHFGEIFGLFYNSNAYFRSRRTWDRL